jgi:hypothetical protein
VTREVPWIDEVQDVAEMVIAGSRLAIPLKCHKELKTVMQKCWEDSKKVFEFWVTVL